MLQLSTAFAVRFCNHRLLLTYDVANLQSLTAFEIDDRLIDNWSIDDRIIDRSLIGRSITATYRSITWSSIDCAIIDRSRD